MALSLFIRNRCRDPYVGNLSHSYRCDKTNIKKKPYRSRALAATPSPYSSSLGPEEIFFNIHFHRQEIAA